MRILLIGTGRAAYHLGHALKRSGAAIAGVAGRNREHAATLAADLGTAPFVPGDDLPPSDLRLVAVSDDAIADVAAALPMADTVTAHLSGAKPYALLGAHAHRGVLWPIQSLSPGAPIDLRTVPLVIEGEDERARTLLRTVAGTLSGQVIELPHEQRQLVHVAAAVAGNLPVFLLYEAQELLRKHGLPPELVVPLWNATTAKAAAGAAQALTGPARRGDTETLRMHLDRLTDDGDLRRAYAVLSELILKTWHPEKRGPQDL
ncbi:MAG: DUF2520 domain-containing protein [Bacteroidetes bacterium]|nr:DUF2520 domain-containing protein [Bacteroidota bacterium]